MSANEKKGSLVATTWISLALIASAIEPLVVKLGYQSMATPSQLLVLKFLFGGLFIAPIYTQLYWIGFDGIRRISGAACLFILTYIFMFQALTSISAVILITIITTTPALVAIINRFRGKEIVGLKFWIGFAFCFVGVLFTINVFATEQVALSWKGIALAFASVFTSAMYRTKMDVITKLYKPICVSGYLFIFNAIAALAYFPWLEEISSQTWKLSIWIGFAGAVANVAFLSALHLIGSTRISILTVLQRPLVIILAAVLLKEPLSAIQISGIVLVLIGVHVAKPQKLAVRKTS